MRACRWKVENGKWKMCRRAFHFPFSIFLFPLLLAACTTPNKANILLRKQNQDLHDRVARLERTQEADRAKIVGLESAATTLPSLPPDRLDELFTVHGLRIGRLSGGAVLDSAKPGDEGLKVYVVPTDQAGEDIKAAGSFTIEAFDLAREKDQKVGRWDFDLKQSKKDWYGSLLYSYVLTCPWQKVPTHSKLTVKITFTDALTGRRFQTQRGVDVELPGG
jgi:hypothetical protein